MKTTTLLAALAIAAAAPAQAAGRLADVSVVDRASGSVLPTYYHQGDYWVAGSPGAKYAILVRNRRNERVLAVAAVDGINVLTGDTAGWEQPGYVFRPWQAYQISGWRKSPSEVAAFEFTASPQSYAERTGRPANVGVIGVALFREKPAEPPPAVPWPEPAARQLPEPLPAPAAAAPQARDQPGEEAKAPEPEGRAASEAPKFDGRAGRSAASAARGLPSSELAAPGLPASPVPAPKLGTGHGQREASLVTRTEFVRLQQRPDEVIRIRYDSRENLVALGVIRERPLQPPVPNPFPESPTARFVPDPPAYR